MDVDLPGDDQTDGIHTTQDDNPDLEVDNEVEDTLANGLKRSSSAPLINQLIAAEQAAESNRFVSASIRHRPVATAAAYLPGSSRWRRWSTSVSPVSPVGFGGVCGGGGGGGQTGWARLNRLKVEETGDHGKSEIATEREVQRELSLEKTLSQSCEDLSLSENKETRGRKRHIGGGSGGGTDPMLPLTIGVGPFPSPRTSPSPSPSPTRSTGTGKQCYSPSMQMPVPTNLSFTPSPSSSPTRRSWASRRSLSPITLRSSQLGPVKRKCMLDDGESTPSKRHSSNLLITHNNTTRAAPYKVPYPSSWSTTPQPSPRPSETDTSRENSPVPTPAGPSGLADNSHHVIGGISDDEPVATPPPPSIIGGVGTPMETSSMVVETRETQV